MKKKIILLLMSMILILNYSRAQDMLTYKTSDVKETNDNAAVPVKIYKFRAYSNAYELEALTAETAGSHPFGENVAKKLYLFNEKYTSQVVLTPGNPASKTVIRKPLIYESVKHIERDLKRSVKKGQIPLDTAIREFNTVLDVALNIVTTDTKDFENAIASAGSIDSKIELFTKRVILNY